MMSPKRKGDYFEECERLREEIARLQQERQRLITARPPLGDLLQTLEREIERRAAGWAQKHGARLAGNLAGKVLVDPHGTVRAIAEGRLASEMMSAGPLERTACSWTRAGLAPGPRTKRGNGLRS